MNADTLDGGRLSEHVRPLERTEDRGQLAAKFALRGSIEFILGKWAYGSGKPRREIHRAAPGRGIAMEAILASLTSADLNEAADLQKFAS